MGNHTRRMMLESITQTIADYRSGEISRPTTEHVDRWLRQFDAGVQEPLIAELDHILKRTYISRKSVKTFLSALVKNTSLAGSEPCKFWRYVEFLDIQQGGESQSDMLELFDEVLE